MTSAKPATTTRRRVTGAALLVAGTSSGILTPPSSARRCRRWRVLRVLPVDLNVGITAYMLALAVVIPLSGWLADRCGARQVFVAAVALFTVASVLCALSGSLAQFTAARILQGVGGALTVPVGRLIVLRASDRRDLIAAVAYLTWPSLLAPIIAPALGGFITEQLSWHWIFLINVPLGVVALVLACVLIPAGGRSRPSIRAASRSRLASVARCTLERRRGGHAGAALAAAGRERGAGRPGCALPACDAP
jgi:MFS family permease